MDKNYSLGYRKHLEEIKNNNIQEDIKHHIKGEMPDEISFQSWLSHKDRVRYINDYDYVPYEYTKHKLEGEDHDLYLGFELEVDGGGTSSPNAKRVIDMLGEDCCFCVNDGSLDSGFEIVTNPATLGFHMKQPYEQLLKFLKMKGYKDSYKAGLHVHINRNFFGSVESEVDFNIAKLMFLVENHWSYTTAIARRENKRYAKRLEGLTSIIQLYTRAKVIGKMSCVNIEHTSSVELRLFAGTLSYLNLMATLEYVNNLALISKETPLEKIQEVTFKDIVEYKPTQYLLQYCNARKIQF